MIKEEVQFEKVLFQEAYIFIKDIKQYVSNPEKDSIHQTQKFIFNWKNNPDNNEKYLRSQLNLP